jgi:hypothetical protein
MVDIPMSETFEEMMKELKYLRKRIYKMEMVLLKFANSSNFETQKLAKSALSVPSMEDI